MPPLLLDPLFYLVAVPSVLLIGLSKGGFGGAMGQIGVPLMALAVSPVQAAAIILPILLVMDAVSLWAWRGERDNRTLKIMLPGAVAGILVGWMTAALVTADMVRLLVGAVALAFFLRWLWQRLGGTDHARPHNPAAGLFWGTVSGFTSFVAHAGGPPYQVYALPLKQDQKLYNGTSVIFFAAVNAIKLVPYFALGQFDATNLSASLVLMPLAPLATLAGAWVVKRISPATFHTMMYCLILIVALKLIYDGAIGLAA